MPLSRGFGEVMFSLVQDLLKRCRLDLKKSVAIAIDGAPYMMGIHQGVVV